MQQLKIGILSRGPRLYSTRRLREAAEQRGHKVKVLNTMKFGMYIEAGRPDLTYYGKQISHYDAVIPRIGTSITFYGTALVRQFEQIGTYCLNTADAIMASRDKLASMQELSSHNIGIAETAFVYEQKDILHAIQAMGGAPVVIKLLSGTQGIGVILAESNKVAEAIIETLSSVKQNVLVQKFVSESKGRDIRAFVVGDRVVAAMRRTAAGQEFRSNVHRGGATQAVDLDPEYERTAVRAAQILNLHVAGVDMLEGKDGPVIMEVNSSPGLEGIEKASGVDIATEIVKYLEEQIRFGNFDVRERLSLTKGYSVTEFTVEPNAQIAGKTISESGLRERDIVILRIVRGPDHIANPKGTRIIEAGDSLLCYGLKSALQSHLPTLVRPKRRKKKKKPASEGSTAATDHPSPNEEKNA
ncbi:30S ribosomal protein S6--L-glutamate ligase [Pelagicoccus sp. SDUM812003]|uniref:30S ribosomal protein S6--L-glutamate ligase n=1 Tax=Pelagicoccus sp. SDUM812003 TaxID=3041267 RepID=UPI00280E2B73|nr:30S ribosomal protein S6--L-glutamate ligase [Pelagicoccus sp. SDUM812003]MDQ8201907.1 30S ribosomal protein S6--L-glutamate ligase [Pelagicoccus sp. SDUM812003]